MQRQLAFLVAVAIFLTALPSLAQRACSGSASCGFRGQYRRIQCAKDCRDLRCGAVSAGTNYVAQNAFALVEGWIAQNTLVPKVNSTFNATTFLSARQYTYNALAKRAYDQTHCDFMYQDGFCESVFMCQHGYDTETSICTYGCPWTYCDDVRPAVSALVDSIYPDFQAMLTQGLELNSTIANYTGKWETQKLALCTIGRNAMAAQSCEAVTQSSICDPAKSAASLLYGSVALIVSLVVLL